MKINISKRSISYGGWFYVMATIVSEWLEVKGVCKLCHTDAKVIRRFSFITENARLF